MHQNESKSYSRLAQRPTVDYTLSKPPSATLYITLIVIVIILVLLAFVMRSQNWNNIFLNLASELAGAVIILIFVEKRISGVLPGFYRTQSKAYVKLLATNLKVNRMVLYMSRPQVEKEIRDMAENGFILTGALRSGKTVLLHQLVRSLSDDFLRNPREEKIPVLASFQDLGENNDPEYVLRNSVKSYFAVRDRVFNRMLKNQRLVCIFDGLDELTLRENSIQALVNFHRKYPGIPLVISSSLLEIGPLRDLGLPVYTIPPFTENERDKLKRIQERMK